jgi:actin-related protein 5
MAPATVEASMLPPPRVYNVNDAHFEKFQAPQSDGYQKARSRGGEDTAIVIDNGE